MSQSYLAPRFSRERLRAGGLYVVDVPPYPDAGPFGVLGGCEAQSWLMASCTHLLFFTSYSVETGFARSPVAVNSIFPVTPSYEIL